MQTFDRNPLYYHQFIRGFDSLFKCVDDPESKFQYLIKCCRGKAYKVVEPCAKIESSEEAYNLARERLKKKFGGVQHIVDAHLAQVADGPHIKQDDVASLGRLLVNMESCCLTLSSWNAKDRLNSPETLSKILDRLPTRLQHQFNEKCAELHSTQQEPTFEKLMNFLETRVTLAESRLGKRLMNRGKRTATDVSATHISKATAIPKPQVVSSFSTQDQTLAPTPQEQSPRECVVCKGDHNVSKCRLFAEKSLEQKKQLISENRLCYNCLRSGHIVRNCRSRPCTVSNCGRKHHTLIHPPESQDNQEPEQPHSSSQSEQSNVYSVHDVSSVSGFNSVRLKVLPVNVWNWNQSKTVQVYAFLDEGSDTTMCTSKLASKLGINGKDMRLSVRTVNGLSQLKGECISLKVQGLSESKHFQPDVIALPRVLAVNALPSLSNNILNQRDVSRFNHLHDLTIPELASQKVELLVGADVLMAHVQHDIRYGDPGQPAAVLTGLGWTLFGPDSSLQVDNNEIRINYVQTCAVDSLHQKLDRMFRFDFSEAKEVSNPSLSRDDQRALDTMEGTLRLVDRHYQLGLPWREADVALPGNRPMAVKRLHQLKRKLDNEPELKDKYCAKINDYISSGQARQIPEDELKQTPKTWYIPHHATGPKFRVVFDCSASYAGTCLNQKLLPGPDNTNNLLGVLCRFRQLL